MMSIEQLQFFSTKKSFDPSDFENNIDPEFFKKIVASIFEAFDRFSVDNNSFYDVTTKSNMLNNAVAHTIQRNFEGTNFRFIESLSNTRRCFGILDDRYLLMFKKSPVSNVKTYQDDLIKHQKLDKHVLFLTYHVDDLWSEIVKVEFQYFTSPKNVTYTFDVTNVVDVPIPITRLITPMEEVPVVSIKQSEKTKRKSQ